MNVRTAQKWHKEYGMPVFWTPTGKRAAFKALVLEWLKEFNIGLNRRQLGQMPKFKRKFFGIDKEE